MTEKKTDQAERAMPENTNKPTAAAPLTPPDAGKIEIDFSHGLAAFLAANNISLGFTSYQTGRLYLIGSGPDGKLALHEAQYPQAMGIAGDHERIYLGTLTEVVRLENVLAAGQTANNVHDKVYVPRNMQTTGNIDIHELGIRKNGRMVYINTRYSCLCEPDIKHSFKTVWKPDFISKLAPEDRCHLNGLAMVDGEPKYVSAVSRSDVVDGWRDRRHDGGVIIDIESNEIMAEGLSMPHSPRWHDGKLWVLNSGSGELGWIDPADKSFQPVAFFPGFLRGLPFTDSSPSRPCQSHATVALKGWHWTTSSRRKVPMTGAAFISSICNRATSPIGCASTVRSPNCSTSACCRGSAIRSHWDRIHSKSGTLSPLNEALR